MTWLALCDFTNVAYLDPTLEDHCAIASKNSGQFTTASLPRGSFVIEANLSAAATHPIVLMEYSAMTDWDLRFSLRLNPLGDTVLELVNGRQNICLRLKTGHSQRDRCLRLTYSWDVAAQRSLLTIENLLDGVLQQIELAQAIHFPVHIVERLTTLRQTTRVAPETVFHGTTDKVEPVGLSASIAAGAPVATPEGPVRIEKLRAGDMVLTRDHGPQPIRWVGSRDVPTSGNFRPVRLIAPYFGLQRDVLVAPEQRLLVQGAEIEYLFGAEEILVEARYLVNERTAICETQLARVQYFQILLDNHEILDVAGGSLESLYTGSICDDPELLATTMLADVPVKLLPRHENVARQLLHTHEARTLRSVLMV